MAFATQQGLVGIRLYQQQIFGGQAAKAPSCTVCAAECNLLSSLLWHTVRVPIEAVAAAPEVLVSTVHCACCARDLPWMEVHGSISCPEGQLSARAITTQTTYFVAISCGGECAQHVEAEASPYTAPGYAVPAFCKICQ